MADDEGYADDDGYDYLGNEGEFFGNEDHFGQEDFYDYDEEHLGHHDKGNPGSQHGGIGDAEEGRHGTGHYAWKPGGDEEEEEEEEEREQEFLRGPRPDPHSPPPPDSFFLRPGTGSSEEEWHHRFVEAVTAGKGVSFLRQLHSRLAVALGDEYVHSHPEIEQLDDFEQESRVKNCRWAHAGYTLQTSLLNREVTVGRFLHVVRRRGKREREPQDEPECQGEN